MDYCLVQDGALVKGPCALPRATANVSNLHLLDDVALQAQGWVPYYEVRNELPNQVMENSILSITDTAVTKTFVYRNMTEQEILAASTPVYENTWDLVRDERNEKLTKSDWTQLPDAPLTDAEKLNWRTYRQALRDITTQPNSANVTWPQAPGQGIGVAVL